MKYIDCLRLLESAIEANLLAVSNGRILTMMKDGSCVCFRKEDLAQHMMSDIGGQKALKKALFEKGIIFKEIWPRMGHFSFSVEEVRV